MTVAHYARIAELYDAFVKTEYDVPFFLEQARGRGGNILELMAGTGRLTLPLLQAGFRVTALDVSPDMLAVLTRKLRQRGLSAEVHQLDICTFDLGRQFEQVWIPFQAFPELTAEVNQREALKRIHSHLADDGVFICTLHNPPVRLKPVDGLLHLSGSQPLAEDDRLLIWLLQTHDRETNLVTVQQFFEEYDSKGVMKSKRFSEMQFHLLAKSTFEALLTQTGFEVVELYGNYDCSAFDAETSPFMIWFLRKRA